jgi:type III secretory pathway component EscT
LAQVVPELAIVRSWLLGVARVLPSMILVPAFGLRAAPGAARVGLALMLGACIAPALSNSDALPFGLALTLEALRGLPVAISAAATLWAASMAGGLIDELRRGREMSPVPLVSAESGVANILLTLVAALAFLQTGRATRIGSALLREPDVAGGLLANVVRDLLSGVELAIATAVPFVVASVLVDVLSSLAMRSVPAPSLRSIWAPVRSLVFLLLLAAILDRVFALVVLLAARAAT